MAVPREKIASLVILDLECTGLNRPRVTELCLLSVQREELLTPGGRPRVCNKLVLCVNPGKMIEPGASKITGLFNDALESQPMFDEDTVTSISLFLSRLPQPICMLAHNGNNYDFKVLNSEMNRISKTLPGNIYCVDSLEALRALDSVATDESYITARTSSNTATSTPSGQNIPEIPKDVFDIKSRVRQIKRKCDADFDRPPIQAKSVRKRLFDSAGKKDKEENGDPLDLTGHKPMGSSMKMSADVVSKRNTCDVESVKKRLTFDEDEDEDDDKKEDEDIEMSASEEDKNQCQENTSKSDGTIPNSQGSLPDVDFLHAVEHLEHSAKGSETKTHCVTPQSTAKVSACFTPKEQTVNVLSNCEGLCTPETPSTSGQNMNSTNMVSPVRDILGNSRNDECVSLQASPLQRGQSPPSEICLTPMTGLVRSTEAFQLGTPVKDLNKNSYCQSQREVAPNGMACRSLFRQTADVSSAGHRPRAPPLSLYSNRVSYKLGEVYRRTFGGEPDDLHSAESDCVTLMRVVKHRSPDFIQWVDEHAVLLSSTGLY